MQVRIKNLNKGGRGFWVNGEMVEVSGGDTGTFTGATVAERDAIAQLPGIKVQSRVANDGEWTDHFKEEMPEERPWIAYASDATGSDFKPVDAQAWYVGMAVAGERPDSAAGYKWVKVGFDGVNGSDEAEADAVDSDTPPVDYAELVKGNAADVIAKVTPDNAAKIGDAEEKREGGPRKGVMKAVEDAIG